MKKNYVFRVLSLVLIFTMVLSTAAFAFNPQAPGQWKAPGQMKKYLRDQYGYEKAAEYMQNRNIIKGYGDGNFGYEDYVKRGDIAVMVVRAFNLSLLVRADDLDENFVDVVSDSYFYYPVQIAKKLGIAQGDGKNFKPKDFVTVQEAIWLIERSVIAAGDKIEFEDVDLEDLFDENELKEFAKRQDIAMMLYYVLTGDELDVENDNEKDNETINIELSVYDDSVLNFKDKWFTDALKNIKVKEDIEYIKFVLRDESKGKLYYEYVENEDKTLVSDKTKYYLGDEKNNIVENITFVPKKDATGTITIGFNAFTDDGESYPGLIKITINNKEVLKTIRYKTVENKVIYFNNDDFDTSIDEIKFEIPNEKVGKLYYENKSEKKVAVDNEQEFDYEDIDSIFFTPYKDFSGKATVKYTAYEYEKGKVINVYTGEIRITVESVEE